MDTLESAYQKIVDGRQDQIRLYRSDVYYARAAICYNTGVDLTLEEVHSLLYSEGMLPWSDYVSPKQAKKMKEIFNVL